MKVIVFPDVVINYLSTRNDSHYLLNTGKERGLDFVCHQTILNNIMRNLPEEASVLNEFSYHAEIYDEINTEILPESFISNAWQQVQRESYVLLLVLANNLGINNIWNDDERIKDKISIQIFTTSELQEQFPLEKS